MGAPINFYNVVIFFALFVVIYDVCLADPLCASTFRPNLRDLKQGRLRIDITNPTDVEQKYSQFITCGTLAILDHGTQHIDIASGETRSVQYVLGISKHNLKKHPDQFEHKCIHVKWSRSGGKAMPTVKCEVVIRTYPGGIFLEKCKSYEGNDLILEETDSLTSTKQIKLIHQGKLAHYVANISCTPITNLIYNGNMYNYLRDNGTWDILLHPNCSDVIDIDYSGKCRLSVYHMCQERALVAEYTYPYFEGDVEECIVSKSYYVATRAHASSSLNGSIKIAILVFVCTIFLSLFTLSVRSAILAKHLGSEIGNITIRDEVQEVISSVFCCQNNLMQVMINGVSRGSINVFRRLYAFTLLIRQRKIRKRGQVVPLLKDECDDRIHSD